jgi:STE24 endopeptidase
VVVVIVRDRYAAVDSVQDVDARDSQPRRPWGACEAAGAVAAAVRSECEWLGALVLAVAAAEAAVVALRPRDGVIEARRVAADSYFEADEVARARRYVRGQLALGAAAGAAEAALMAWLVARGRSGDGDRGPGSLPGAAADGAALSLALVLAPLPFAALMRARALRAGLATQSWGGWALDVGRSGALGAAFTAAGAVIAQALMRRYEADWWRAGALGSVAVGVAVTLVGPVLLDPIFNDFEPLAEGELRSEVLALAERAGVSVGEVFTVDASRRTNAANAYVNGLGRSRRIVLYDTLLASFTPDQARSVVAHELAHVRYRDVPRQLVFLAAVAPAAMRAIAALAARLDGSERPRLPALALAGTVVSSPVGVVSRQLSRAIERRADAFSLALTGESDSFISFEQRLTRQNLADPDPPGWLTALLGTHPPIVERIGIAEAYKAGARPSGPTTAPARRRWDPRTRAGS